MKALSSKENQELRQLNRKMTSNSASYRETVRAVQLAARRNAAAQTKQH